MIDFNTQRPSQLRRAGEKLQPQSGALFEFEEVEIAERRLVESPKAASRLNDRMAWLIALFVALVPVPYGANRPLAWFVAIAAVALMCLIYFIGVLIVDRNRPVQMRNYWSILALGFLAIIFAALQASPLGIFTSVSQSQTMLAVPRMLSYGLIFVLVSEVCTNRFRTEKLLRTVFYVIVIHAAWALLSLSVLGDTLLFADKTEYLGVATGTFINRNSFATFMGFGVVIGLAMIVFEMRSPAHRSPNRKSKRKGLTADVAFIGVFVLIILAALVASASRLGLISTVIGAWFTMVLLLLRTGVSGLRVFGLTSAVVLLGIVGFVAVSGEVLLNRLVFIFVDSDTRIELFKQTWDMVLAFKWTGVGLDAYQVAFEQFHRVDLSFDAVWDKPHNTYLTLWSEMGFVAGSLPMLAVLVSFLVLVRSVRTRERSYFPAAAAAGVIVQGAIHSLGDFSLEIAANTYVFVIIVALGLARRSRAREV